MKNWIVALAKPFTNSLVVLFLIWEGVDSSHQLCGIFLLNKNKFHIN